MEVKPGYKQTEAGVIPEEWDVSRLGECGEVVMGQSPSGSSYNRKGVGSPLINGPTEFTDRHPIKMQWTTEPARFCKTGDLLICVRGSSTGRTNYANDTYAIGRGVAAIRAKGDNDTEYLSYQVISGVSGILAAATGSTFPSVDGASFRKIVLPLPTPAEQRAIAEALSNVDALLGELDRLIAKKRNIKLAAMQQLLTGKTRLPEFHVEWEETTLGQIGECIIGLTYKPEDTVEHGLLVLRASNIQNGRLAYDDNVYVSLEVAANLYTRFGDILNCVRNGSRALIGKCAVIDEVATGVTFGAFMSIYRTRHWPFIFHAFQAQDIQRQIRDNIGATINQITNKDLKSFRVKLPSEDEQIAIARVLGNMDAELAALAQRREKTRDLKQAMMQELLTGKTRLVQS